MFFIVMQQSSFFIFFLELIKRKTILLKYLFENIKNWLAGKRYMYIKFN